MKGRITSIEEIENEESGYIYRRIVVMISEPSMPYQPAGYVVDWRAQLELTASCNKSTIEAYKRYEEEMKTYHQKIDESNSFHIGDSEIIQVKGGE